MCIKHILTLCLLLNVFTTLAFAQNDNESSASSLTELYALLHVEKVGFVPCLGEGKTLQERCWKNGKEGGEPLHSYSQSTEFYKDNTGLIFAKGYEENFSWTEKDNFITTGEAPYTSKYQLINGIYLISISDPQITPSILVAPDPITALQLYKSKFKITSPPKSATPNTKMHRSNIEEQMSKNDAILRKALENK